MPKRKSAPRASKKKSPPTSPPSRKPSAPAKATAPRQNYTEEYTDYLERYELYGEGRPRLSPAEFCCAEQLAQQ